MSVLNELLEDINARVATNLKLPKTKYFAEAFLQVKDEKTFPLVNKGSGSGYQISLNDNYALQSYHRVISNVTETDPTKGKGKYPYTIRVYTIRNVWLGTLKRLPSKPYENTDDIKNAVYNAFPTILTNKEIIQTTTESTNKLEVLNEEFDGNEFKQLSLDTIAFYIEYEIRQKIKCN